MYQHGLTFEAEVEERRLAPTHSQGSTEPERALRSPSENEEADVRHDLVARVRREIAEGTYDTEARWEAALDRLCERRITE